MKTLRFIGMAVVAIIMSVNFIACSDDDDDIDVSQLEGTWGLVRNVGWDESDGEKDSWDYTHTPNSPCCGDCTKLIIKKISDNTYSVDLYYYDYDLSHNLSLTYYGNQTISINGNTVTINKTNVDPGFFESDENTTIEYLTSDKLAFRFKNENTETEKMDVVMEFIRME